jgi:hypothetical protein
MAGDTESDVTYGYTEGDAGACNLLLQFLVF